MQLNNNVAMLFDDIFPESNYRATVDHFHVEARHEFSLKALYEQSAPFGRLKFKSRGLVMAIK